MVLTQNASFKCEKALYVSRVSRFKPEGMQFAYFSGQFAETKAYFPRNGASSCVF
jgi:hypothetical protein